jgi:hypothetical protein
MAEPQICPTCGYYYDTANHEFGCKTTREYDGFASFPKGRLDDHEPECVKHREEAAVNAGGWDYGVPCICEWLRAAHERGTARAYDRGLVDAAEVVKYHTTPRIGQPTVLEWLNGPSEIISAINNLRSKND